MTITLLIVSSGPPPTPSTVVISSTPSTDSPSSGYDVRMMTSVTVDRVSVGGVPTSPASIPISIALQNQFCYFNKSCLCTEFHPIAAFIVLK